MSPPCLPRTVLRPDQAERLLGLVLFRQDKDLGELEEVVGLGPHRYFVLDARHWSFGARKLLPVAAVAEVDLGRRRAFTTLELELIRRSPDFDPFLLSSDAYAARVAACYS